MHGTLFFILKICYDTEIDMLNTISDYSYEESFCSLFNEYRHFLWNLMLKYEDMIVIYRSFKINLFHLHQNILMDNER